MKKVISVLLAITMMAIVLVGCGSKTDSLFGTWKADSVEVDGVKYTIAELEAMGDDSMSGAQIVIKDGGKAYVADGEDGDIVDWVQTETGIKIGEQDCAIVDGMICLEYGEGKVFFKMISDSQIIGAVQDNDVVQNSTDAQTENTTSSADEEPQTDSSVTIKNSPDKYTWYIKNYVGKNCASIGYTSLGGDRMDHYGAGYIELVLVAPDGAYIDIETDDVLKQYVVTSQSYAPNTELKYVFETDDEGNEYDNLVQSQNIEEIVLCVKKVGSSEETTLGMTEITPSPDKYTWYIRDYTGRNLASCGYLSMSGKRMDHYGAGYIKFVIVADDGSFIDPEDTELLKNYVITGQSVAPNTELKYEFETDSDGNEYENLVRSQNLEEIEITVKLICTSD